MCILFIHVNPNPKENEYRLIVASNRDEMYKRPAKEACKCEETGIIGGVDMEFGREGGMWLGFKSKNDNGKAKTHCFAALLNLSGEKISNADGRGIIVKEYLEENDSFMEYIGSLEDKNLNFSGFNFVAVELSKDGAKTYQYSNNPKVMSVYSGKQTLGFGNSPIFCPLTKVLKGRTKLESLVSKELPKNELINELLNLLKDDNSYLPDDELQRRQPVAYEMLSSIFVNIKQHGYGTRTHTLILIDHDWNLDFVEHTLQEPIDVDNPKWVVNEIKSHL